MIKNNEVMTIIVAMMISFVGLVSTASYCFAENTTVEYVDDYRFISKYEPKIVGEPVPEKVYYRLVKLDDNEFCAIFVYYWPTQEFYISQHEHDYEPVFVFVRDGNLLMVAYDEWHYEVGRIRDVHTDVDDGGRQIYISFEPNYRSIRIEDRQIPNPVVELAERKYINPVVESVMDSFGLDADLLDYPFELLETGMFGNYKRRTFWNTYTRSFLVVIDKKVGVVNFEKRSWLDV